MEHYKTPSTYEKDFYYYSTTFLATLSVYSKTSENELDQIRDRFKEINLNIN